MNACLVGMLGTGIGRPGLLTGVSLPLEAEAGLATSLPGDRDGGRSSSAPSSSSLGSSKFMLPDRPAGGETSRRMSPPSCDAVRRQLISHATDPSAARLLPTERYLRCVTLRINGRADPVSAAVPGYPSLAPAASLRLRPSRGRRPTEAEMEAAAGSPMRFGFSFPLRGLPGKPPDRRCLKQEKAEVEGGLRLLRASTTIQP